MTISYYHIFNLQNDTPELNKLVNDLEIKDLILQEKETIKWKIMQFMRSLRSDILKMVLSLMLISMIKTILRITI